LDFLVGKIYINITPLAEINLARKRGWGRLYNCTYKTMLVAVINGMNC